MKEGWTYKKLGEVCEIIGGGTPDKKNMEYFKGDIPWATVRDMNCNLLSSTDFCISKTGLNNSASHLIGKGEIIIATRVGLGKVCKLAQDTAINQDLKGIVPKGDNIDRDFLFYYFKSKAGYIESNGVGATVKGVKLKFIEDLLFPTIDISEQQSIVDYLDSAFAKIDALKANAEKQVSEARALFQKALTEEMKPKEGWEEKKLGEICEIFGRIGFRGYTTKDLVSSSKDGAISLSPSNIKDNGKMDFSKLTYISWYKYEESPEIKIYNGDILLVKTGSSYGKSALVEDLPHEATINPQSVVLKNFMINNKFFAYQLRTDVVRAEFEKFVSGTAIPTFSQAKLSTVPIHFPNEESQQFIVSRLDTLSEKVRQLEAIQQNVITECDKMKQALLREVFE